MEKDEIKNKVKEGYGRVALENRSCCGAPSSCCGSSASIQSIGEMIGYSKEEMNQVPEGANLGLGCGNPVALASLREGQTVLDLVQELENLKVERNAAKVRTNYRDLYLDRSRALYELEVNSDLGDAMTRVTEAQWLAAQVEFRLALAWARLDALTGDLIQPSTQEHTP